MINLPPYYIRILDSRILEDRHLYLRYRDGCAVTPDEERNVLHVILNTLLEPDNPIVHPTAKQYELAITKFITRKDRKRGKN